MYILSKPIKSSGVVMIPEKNNPSGGNSVIVCKQIENNSILDLNSYFYHIMRHSLSCWIILPLFSKYDIIVRNEEPH